MAFGFTYTLPTITGSHSDFPVLLQEADFPSAAIDGTANAIDNGGGNLRAYTSDAKTTQLPLEIVTFVSSGTPEAEVWIKIPTAATSNTIFIEADAVETAQPAVTATYGRDAVWADYKMAYQYNDDPSGGTLTDSAGNTDGTTTGTFISGDQVSGKIGSGWEFDSGDYVTTNTSLTAVDQDKTISEWVNFGSTTSQTGIWSLDDIVASSTPAALLAMRLGNLVTLDTGVYESVLSTPSTATDYKIDYVYNATTDITKVYINGSEATSYASDNGAFTDTDPSTFYINNGFNGQLDMQRSLTRYSENVRNADFLATEYDNQNASSNWGTVGAWADAAGGDFTLTAETGGYTYTGTASSLLLSALLGADTAQYTYSGTSVDLTFAGAGSFTINAETAQYTYSGTNTGLLLAASLDAETVQYTYSGTAATLTKNFSMTGETAQYTYSGTDAAMQLGAVMVTESTQYTYSGTNISLSVSGRIVIGVTMYPNLDNRNMFIT